MCLLNSGILLDKIIELNTDLPKVTIEKIQNFINEAAKGLSIFELKCRVESILQKEYSEIHRLKNHIQLLIDKICSLEEHIEQLYTGNINFLDDPELQDINRTKKIIKLLEDEREIKKILLDTLSDDELRIRIGRDLKSKEFKDFSVITSPYKIGDSKLGVIGVLGPMRMEYPNLISLVNYISNYLSVRIEKLLRV